MICSLIWPDGAPAALIGGDCPENVEFARAIRALRWRGGRIGAGWRCPAISWSGQMAPSSWESDA